ncbi:recombination regulator RecX [Burkholderia sp. R-70199]|nr:recombination regulator RecX [Burkholderia sp. R-70199]MBK5119453.1 recombination regulator RecX [Burkholderia sp. R-69980]MBK5179243.1 recombination regulator RecX [Burkholderia sp. R-69749]MCI0145518.1 recombination regulator RecX [Paraburkholderia sediminicola]
MRKGRPQSNAANAGRNADGPRDGDDDSFESSSPSSSSPSSSSTSRSNRSFGRSSGNSSGSPSGSSFGKSSGSSFGRSTSRSPRYPAGNSAARRSSASDSDPFAAAGEADPFESFDAHDRASGRQSQTESSAQAETDPSETTYTRSRRTPGEAKPGQDEAKKSQRPARSLKGRALGYLSRREYSRAELARKLKPFVEETDSLDAVLDALEAENWLSDSRFAESLIHRRSSRLGASRIVGELKQHAVDQTLVEEASAQLRETELARAQAVWRKKFGQLPETAADRAKQARFLASRGFSGATIGKILKGFDEE